MSSRRVTLLTGSTGYLGGLTAVTMLQDLDQELVVPIRGHHGEEGFWQPVLAEMTARFGSIPAGLKERVHVVALPDLGRLDELGPVFAEYSVSEIVHCAGCVDYFDAEMLQAVNVNMTRDLLQLGVANDIDRFVYVSTAFSGGMTDGTIAEELHRDPGEDPTEYTQSKRQAEWLVAESGLPFLIVRPPIVIGDSVDGRYGGKRYGVYQLWAGMERLFFAEWFPDVHFVAPAHPVPMLHQDAFQDALGAALTVLPDGSIFNMVPPDCPNLREMAMLWYPACMAPERLHLYPSIDEVPLRDIDRRQRAFLGLTSTNIRISSHLWDYEIANTEKLGSDDIGWANTTIDSIAICQDRFVRSSEKIQRFIEANASRFGQPIEVITPCLTPSAT